MASRKTRKAKNARRKKKARKNKKDIYGNKWLTSLSVRKYKTLVYKTRCSHCFIPFRISTGPPLSSKRGLSGAWTCSECAEDVVTGRLCSREYPLYQCGVVGKGEKPERFRMYVDT
jgi:hypothetical protein